MRSPINLNRINKSFDGLRESIKGAKDISQSISSNLDESIKVDRQRISMSSRMFARKRDLMRRRSKEELLEASGITSAIRNTGKVIKKTTRGFLGRILDFVGTVIMGWAILNLPKIIKLAQDLMKRMKKYFDILTGFTQNLTVFFTGFQNNLKEISEKLRAIDFEPTLNQIKNFMKKVQDSFTRITIGTVQTINKFLGASEDEMARQVSPEFYELYKRLSGASTSGEDDEKDDEAEDDDTSDDSNMQRMSNEELIKNGIQNLKDKQGGKLTKDQQDRINNNDYMDIHEMLESNGFQIYVDEETGGMAYFDQTIVGQFQKQFDDGNVRPLTLNEIPYGDGKPPGSNNINYEDIKEKIEKSPIIESLNKNILRDQFQLPESVDQIDIDIPFDRMKDFFNNGIMREDPNYFDNNDINNNNKIIKDQAKQQVDN